MIEFNISIQPGNKIEKREGKLISLKVENIWCSFVIQKPENILTHYKTGFAVSTRHIIKNKKDARDLIRAIIDEHGVDEIFKRLASKPVINHD